MTLGAIFNLQSVLILILMYVGLYFRKQRSTHVKIMASAIVWDILLILQIELSRSAIKTASKVMSNPMIMNIHISLAVSTVVLYFVLIFLGRKLLRGENQVRNAHKMAGWLCIVLRTCTLITSTMIPTTG